MAGKLSHLKPNASRSAHLFVAAFIWTIVGLSLMARGGIWLMATNQLWLMAPALLLGTVKSKYMLDRSAEKSIRRIIATRDGRCIGGVYSIKTWMLVAVMMAAGIVMRKSSLPREFMGFFYCSIGWGLFYSSRNAWIAWRQCEKISTGAGF